MLGERERQPEWTVTRTVVEESREGSSITEKGNFLALVVMGKRYLGSQGKSSVKTIAKT